MCEVFHVLQKYSRENAGMQNRKFDDVTLRYSQWTAVFKLCCGPGRGRSLYEFLEIDREAGGGGLESTVHGLHCKCCVKHLNIRLNTKHVSIL